MRRQLQGPQQAVLMHLCGHTESVYRSEGISPAFRQKCAHKMLCSPCYKAHLLQTDRAAIKRWEHIMPPLDYCSASRHQWASKLRARVVDTMMGQIEKEAHRCAAEAGAPERWEEVREMLIEEHLRPLLACTAPDIWIDTRASKTQEAIRNIAHELGVYES